GFDLTTSNGITIGGTAPGAGNVIAGSSLYALFFNGSATDYVVQGNLIGTDVTGTRALGGNTQAGVAFFAGASGDLVGGTQPGARNVISGNHYGVLLSDPEIARNVVQGNFIGTQVDGVSPLGNSADGVFITAGSHDNLVGGSDPGAGNIIAFNGGNGIGVGG